MGKDMRTASEGQAAEVPPNLYQRDRALRGPGRPPWRKQERFTQHPRWRTEAFIEILQEQLVQVPRG